jgi:hypothetical protein
MCKTVLKAEIKALFVILCFFGGFLLLLWGTSLLGFETQDSKMLAGTTLAELILWLGIVAAIYLCLHLHAHFIIFYHFMKFTLQKIPFTIRDCEHEAILAQHRPNIAVLWRFTNSPFGSIGCYPWVAFIPDSSNRISVSKLPLLGLAVSALVLVDCFSAPRLWNISFAIFYFSGFLLQILSGLRSFQNQWEKHGAKPAQWPFEKSV